MRVRVFALISLGTCLVFVGWSGARAGDDIDRTDYRHDHYSDLSGKLSSLEEHEIRELARISDYFQEAVRADLDGDGSDEIVVLTKEFDGVFCDVTLPASGIVRLESGQVEYLYRFPADYVNADPLVADMNGDGIADLMYTGWSGGNSFRSTAQTIVWWDGSAFRHQTLGSWRSFPDIDGDGLREIETTYEFPEAEECALRCDTAQVDLRMIQYAPSMVWGWRHGAWVDVSDEAGAFFREIRLPDVAARRRHLEAIVAECGESDCAGAIKCLLECLMLVEARANRLAGLGPDERADLGP